MIVAAHDYLTRRGQPGAPRLGPMTARICQGSDSHSVVLAGVAEVLERCEERTLTERGPSRVVLGVGVVAASFWCGYADRHGRVAWLRGRSRG